MIRFLVTLILIPFAILATYYSLLLLLQFLQIMH